MQAFKPTTSHYKFRDLKVYASTEWLADNKKKYRQVFDRYETTYVYAELSFYNKLFDEQDWEIEVELRCYSSKKGNRQLCTLPFKRKVNKYDPIVYIREGWGNQKEGMFWKKGAYYWEAWVDGKKVGTKFFYIEDAGRKETPEDQPYVSVQSLRLYEASYDDLPADKRIYYRKFDSEATRSIFVELALNNHNILNRWQCELFVKFYNDARELKGQVVRLMRIERNQLTIETTAGWGSNMKGSWRQDKYTAEVVFMDELLAVIPFEVTDEFERGNAGVMFGHAPANMLTVELPKRERADSFDTVMTQLDGLIGLSAVKKQVRDHAAYLEFKQLRKERGFKEEGLPNIHAVLTGNPGTGKTTVAKMMGEIYHHMGLLTKGHVHEVDRVDLVGEYIGQTAPKVKEAIDQARGGILFIDEAYALARSNEDSKDFGREVIEILLKEMSNGPGDLAVIVAGYPKEMHAFLDSNPGLRSRFKVNFDFADYLPQELQKIALVTAEQKEVVLTDEAREAIDRRITKAYRSRDRNFGNARYVIDLIESAKINLGLRIMQDEERQELSKAMLSTITLADVVALDSPAAVPTPDIPVENTALEAALAQLDAMIGLDAIKTQIHEMVDLVRYYHRDSREVLNRFFMHTVFVGNPGTGKTTVARILADIYRALGILERGHLVETDREGLVAGFVGQTATKTSAKIDEAMDGILYIDEAYALVNNSHHNDFGQEAIQTLLKRMEDDRGRFFVFAAGYPGNMESFLKANPGLHSRFDKLLKFDDYTPEQMLLIAHQMLAESQLHLSQAAEQVLLSHLRMLYDRRDRYFGNAREVRKLVRDVERMHSLRMAAEAADSAARGEVTVEDLTGLNGSSDTDVFQKKTIGFRARG